MAQVILPGGLDLRQAQSKALPRTPVLAATLAPGSQVFSLAKEHRDPEKMRRQEGHPAGDDVLAFALPLSPWEEALRSVLTVTADRSGLAPCC